MADDHDQEFEATSSGASATFPQQCSALRKNGHVVLKGKPCKIVEMSTSKTGKHGHAKVHLVGLDIFTGKKYEDICPSTHNMDVPNVTRQEYQVILFQEDYFQLMDDSGDIREDLKVDDNCTPPDASQIEQMLKDAESSGQTLVATVIKAMDEERVKEVKLKTVN